MHPITSLVQCPPRFDVVVAEAKIMARKGTFGSPTIERVTTETDTRLLPDPWMNEGEADRQWSFKHHASTTSLLVGTDRRLLVARCATQRIEEEEQEQCRHLVAKCGTWRCEEEGQE